MYKSQVFILSKYNSNNMYACSYWVDLHVWQHASIAEAYSHTHVSEVHVCVWQKNMNAPARTCQYICTRHILIMNA